jgi:hypothetical protein
LVVFMTMNGVFTLETAEIVYLSSLLGYAGFSFLELDGEAIAEEEWAPLMDRCQAQLERRRYIDVGFDGNVVMDEEVYDFISAGATCSTYFQQLIAADSASRTLYVVGGSRLFEVETIGHDSFRIRELFGLHSLQARIISRWDGLRERTGSAEPRRLGEEELAAFVRQAAAAGGSMCSIARYRRASDDRFFKQAELAFLTDFRSIWQVERRERAEETVYECAPSHMHHAMCKYTEWFRQQSADLAHP